MADLWFSVLGPIRVWRCAADHHPGGAGPAGPRTVEVDLGAPQQRAVLAVLLARAGHPVGLAELVDVLWGEDPPATAVNAVHRSVGLLRRALEPTLASRGTGRWLVRAGGGYRLAVDAGTVDLLRFRQLLTRARAEASVRLFGQALDLWQGPAAGTVAAEIRGRPVFTALDRELESAAREGADAALAAGEPAVLLRAVELAADRAPLDESLQARLMLLLAGTGQQAAALHRYDAVRARLAGELGIDPGAELVAAWERVLRPAPRAVAPPPTSAAPAPAPRRFAQLPGDPSPFTGRRSELAAAAELLDGESPATVVIGGPAGIGKTTLAVHWAHRLAGRYPDGQLFLNLRGAGPAGQVMDPGEAVVRFLDALGVPPHRIPAGLDARAALFRSELAGRRMLVLLDDARDTAQVRPLLPGAAAAGCLVLVTSRDRLAGLVASDGARPITLGPLSTGAARRLLTRRLGAARVAAEPAAVDELLGRCAGLPLALAILAARAATHPRPALRDLAADLREEHGRRDPLAVGAPDGAVRTVCAWSYHTLNAAAARLFRLLGLHPGADIPVLAAASLAGVEEARARRLLAELVRAGLLAEHTPGRFTVHDLLRAYATELAHTTDPEARRRTAGGRLLDHYLHTAHLAALLLAPARAPIVLPAPAPGTTLEPLTGQDRAQSWLTAEYRVLQALLAGLAGTGADGHAWQLAWTLDTFQRRQGHLHEQVATRRTALVAAQRLADPALLADTHRDLGHALSGADQPEEARTHFTCALDGYTDLGDLAGQAHAERGIGHSYLTRGQPDKTLLHCLRAEELFRAAGHRHGLAQTLNDLGSVYAELGDLRPALACGGQALALFRQLGDRHGEAASLINLGDAHHAAGDGDAAAAAWSPALRILRDLGDAGARLVQIRLDQPRA